ncbi:MAG: hypothetical protein ACJ76H_04320 [Bacteriovoracaceae bacterium]
MSKQNEKGQALLELVIFLPLMFVVYGLVTGFANAIFGSINQQKFTRNYFYYRVQNNSTIPRRPPSDVNWKKFGMYFVGWREKMVADENPYAPCYRVSIMVKGADNDSCEESYSGTADDRPSTQYMRVGTVYGFCGATYVTEDRNIYPVPHKRLMSYQSLLDNSSCSIDE